MAAGVGRLRRLAAAVLLPVSGALAAFRARRRGRRSDDLGRDARVSWSRRRLGSVVRIRCDVDAQPASAAGAGVAVAAAVAEAAARLGLTIGSVGIVPGEEPHLVALAPRRDLVAPAVLDALAWRGGHPRPHLWLALPPGTYLASVVDPFRPFAGGDEFVVGLVRSGAVRCALATERSGDAGVFRVRLACYCPRSDLGALVGFVRAGLESARERTAAR